MDSKKIKKLHENSRKVRELYEQVKAENVKAPFKLNNHESWERCFKPLIKMELLLNESEAVLDELEDETDRKEVNAMNELEKMNVFDRVNYIKKTIAKVEKEIAEEPISKKVRTNWGLVIRNKMMAAVALWLEENSEDDE